MGKNTKGKQQISIMQIEDEKFCRVCLEFCAFNGIQPEHGSEWRFPFCSVWLKIVP